MSDYRFHLEKYRPNSKLTCPQCKKLRCLVHYVDDQGIVKFPNYVGRCDHENSCGYHYTPKDYFHDNPDMKPKDWDDDTPIYNKVGTTKGNKRIFRLYLVGTGNKWGGCTVFWQIDANGNVRAGKLMGYDSKTGHRIKEPKSLVTWAHAELKLADFHLVQCLFGEHLLREKPTATVGLVESEKTALVMTHFMPDLLWLATGGKDGCFNENAVQVLKGRTVILIPDLGGWEKWQKKSQMLKPICKRVIMSDVIEKIATDEQREHGLDVADFFLMKPTAHEILADMIRRNPAVGLLVEKLDLEVCNDEEPQDGVP